MLKYIVVVILIILGGLLFVNKDKLSSLSGTDNAAAVINSDIAKCGEGGSYINKDGNCYCPQRKSVISWYSVCSLGTTKQYTLKVNKSGKGSGSLTPMGTKKYLEGTTVNVSATANKGSFFTGFSGSCSTPNTSCSVVMNSNKTVTGSFGVIKKKDDLCKKISREEYIDRIQRSTWDQKTKDRLIESSKDMPFFSWCAYYEW